MNSIAQLCLGLCLAFVNNFEMVLYEGAVQEEVPVLMPQWYFLLISFLCKT